MPGLSFIYPGALWLLLLLVPLWALALAVPRRLSPLRFWSSLLLRTVLVVTLTLSLAGAQFVRPVKDLTTVFLIDSSDSVSPSARGQAETFVQEALRHMGDDQQAAIVVFGENALVERAPGPETGLGRIRSVPVATQTDIEEAITLGLALFPADAQKRLVLLSDGGQTTGSAQTAARLAAARGVPLDIVPLRAPAADAEVLVAALDAPASARQGQDLTLTATLVSSTAQPVRLRVFADQQVLADQTLDLPAGASPVQLTVPARGRGFQRYRVVVEPQQDGRVQNNEAAALVEVQGPPRVLLVEGAPGEAQALAAALQATAIDAETVAPAQLPGDLAGLSAYEAVVLVNVPARAVSVGAMAALPGYVRDLGKGLVMVGGDESYGVGGYGRTPVEEALPVYMDVRDREERPDLALVFVIDKSGSMDSCHCSGPSRRTAQFQQGGERKVDIAKEAVTQAAALLTPQDTLGIVAFDEGADWVLPLTEGATVDQVADSVANVEPRGATNVRAGLQAAEEMLSRTDTRIKHVVLLTDGWGGGGSNLDIAQRMREAGITLTVVAAGGGSADYLEDLATAGGGRYYPAQDMAEVPQIFLQETITAVGNYIIEEPFVPALAADSAILDGLGSAVPQLYGYNGTTVKDTARPVLVAGDGAPVLATWQYGLGRSVAWTSDAKGKWARDWLAWSQFPRFAGQLVGWVLPSRSSQTVSADLSIEGARTVIDVTVAAESGQPREDVTMAATLLSSDGVSQTVELTQVAPGRYQGSITSPPPGTYLVQLAGRSGERAVVQEVAGLVVPYSPEYRQQAGNPALLAELARATGGRELAMDAVEQVFAPTSEAVSRAQEIALPLLLLALLLLPVDIAMRRLMLRRADFAALGARLNRRPAPPPASPTLTRLAQAKSRATQLPRRAQPGRPGDRETGRPEDSEEKRAAARSEDSRSPQPSVSPPPADDPLERLREAKERARRRARGEE